MGGHVIRSKDTQGDKQQEVIEIYRTADWSGSGYTQPIQPVGL